jgi:hypothetical protein
MNPSNNLSLTSSPTDITNNDPIIFSYQGLLFGGAFVAETNPSLAIGIKAASPSRVAVNNPRLFKRGHGIQIGLIGRDYSRFDILKMCFACAEIDPLSGSLIDREVSCTVAFNLAYTDGNTALEYVNVQPYQGGVMDCKDLKEEKYKNLGSVKMAALVPFAGTISDKVVQLGLVLDDMVFVLHNIEGGA